MRFVLVNPPWSFDGSVYFGCRDPHLPLEFGYAKALLERAGHEATIIDAHLFGLTPQDVRSRVAGVAPDVTVVTTAPSYLFWRCAPPELRVPMATVAALGDVGGRTVAVGPHGSTAPRAALAKLGVDAVVMGECEEVLAALADADDWSAVPHVATPDGDGGRVNGGPAAARFADLPALAWPDGWIARHTHHHHRFDQAPAGPGAEVEASRGCPFTCTFCAKENFRDAYRKRPLPVLLEEIDRLIAQGVGYVYFVDEIFLPDAALLEALAERPVRFGVQTRLDIWKPAMIDLLGRAGCVSIEAGVESLTPEGRARLDKKCRLDTDAITDRLRRAKAAGVPFVQANLIACEGDDPAEARRWRDLMRSEGVWANDPVPLFPYPGSPEYRRLWGLPDDRAWERAVDHYLGVHARFCDLQDERPRPLAELEAPAPAPREAA